MEVTEIKKIFYIMLGLILVLGMIGQVYAAIFFDHFLIPPNDVDWERWTWHDSPHGDYSVHDSVFETWEQPINANIRTTGTIYGADRVAGLLKITNRPPKISGFKNEFYIFAYTPEHEWEFGFSFMFCDDPDVVVFFAGQPDYYDDPTKWHWYPYTTGMDLTEFREYKVILDRSENVIFWYIDGVLKHTFNTARTGVMPPEPYEYRLVIGFTNWEQGSVSGYSPHIQYDWVSYRNPAG